MKKNGQWVIGLIVVMLLSLTAVAWTTATHTRGAGRPDHRNGEHVSDRKRHITGRRLRGRHGRAYDGVVAVDVGYRRRPAAPAADRR